MADVSKILKPRRGLASTMATAAKSGIVLAKGELFVEAPSTGMGTGASKVKIGDGTTAYSALPYALGDTSNDKIAFSSNTSTTVAAALNSVASGNSLKTLIAGLKQAISLCNTSITQLNDDIDEAGGIGMTTEQANQLEAIYNKMNFDNSIIIPYLDNISSSYGGLTKLQLNGYSTIKIGSLNIADQHPSGYKDNSYFGIFDINDTSLSNPIYKKTAGTILTNEEIDISNYNGIFIILCTTRPSSNNINMSIVLTNIEIK